MITIISWFHQLRPGCPSLWYLSWGCIKVKQAKLRCRCQHKWHNSWAISTQWWAGCNIFGYIQRLLRPNSSNPPGWTGGPGLNTPISCGHVCLFLQCCLLGRSDCLCFAKLISRHHNSDITALPSIWKETCELFLSYSHWQVTTHHHSIKYSKTKLLWVTCFVPC